MVRPPALLPRRDVDFDGAGAVGERGGHAGGVQDAVGDEPEGGGVGVWVEGGDEGGVCGGVVAVGEGGGGAEGKPQKKGAEEGGE